MFLARLRYPIHACILLFFFSPTQLFEFAIYIEKPLLRLLEKMVFRTMIDWGGYDVVLHCG